MTKCPNKNTEEWKALVSSLGDVGAYKAWLANNEELPSLEEIQKINTSKDYKESNEANWLKYLQSEKLINEEPFPKDGNYYVSKGRTGEDNGTNISMFQRRIEKLNKINAYYYTATGGMNVFDIVRTKNSAYIKFNPLAVSAINEYRKQYQIEDFKNVPSNQKLDDIIISWLNSKGISVEAVKSILTRFGGEANALADFTNKVVKIATGKLKIDTLPEEAGHFFIEMLGKESPLYKRYMMLASKSNMLAQVKEEYKDVYTTEEQFVKEAAGKLLAKAIVDKFTNEENQSLTNALVNTAKLIWAKIKSFFKPDDSFVIDQLVNYEFGKAASYILNDTLEQDQFLNKDLKESKGGLFQLSETESLKDIISKATKRLEQKLKIAERSKINDEYNFNLQEAYENLKDNQNVEGFIKFVEQATVDINFAYLKYNRMLETNNKIPLSELRSLRNYVLTYDILDEFVDYPFKDKRLRGLKAYIQNSKVDEGTKEIQESIINKKNEIKQIFKSEAKKQIADFLYSYGKSNPNLTSEIIENQLNYIDGDISVAVAYLDTIGDSKDQILALSSKVIRKAKESSRLKHIAVKKRILDSIEKYEKATGKSGLDMYKGLYDLDNEGNPTGYWVGQIDGQFNIDKKAERKRLEKLHKGDETKVKEGLKKWTKKYIRYDSDGNMIVDPKYTKQWKALKADKHKYELYKELKNIMSEAEMLLPDTYNMYNKLPQTHKSFGERLRSNLKGSKDLISNEIKDSLTVQQDDTQYGLMDESGKPFDTIPIYFTAKLKDKQIYDKAIKDGKSEEEANQLAYEAASKDLNLDLGSTINAFFRMALNFNEMSSIKDELETIKEFLAERKVAKTRFGKVVTNPLTGEVITESGETSNAYKMFSEYIAMQMYGQMKAEGKTVNVLGYDIDLGKVADLFNKYTALNGLALNLFSGFSNITMGNVYRLMESIAGQYFNNKDLGKAELIYFENLPSSVIKDTGNRLSKSKLGLWNEYFDVLQNYDETNRNFKAYNKNKFARLFKTNSLFFINTAGEHYMQSLTVLAAAQNWKLSDGTVVNLWEKATINGKGGLSFSGVSQDELQRFMDITKGINQSLDGVYNDVDKSIAQRYAVGRLALLFRKFIVPGFQKRWKTKRFNYRTETLEEGMYLTTGKFMFQLLKDLKALQFNLIAHWKDMSEFEKANVKRTLTEVTFMIGLAVLTNTLEDWEDDDKEKQFLIYEANRVFAELSFFHNPNEALKILKSPAAAVTSVQTLQGLVGMTIQPWNWSDRYERGRLAGDLKIGVKFTDAIPIVNKIKDWEDIGKQIDYIK